MEKDDQIPLTKITPEVGESPGERFVRYYKEQGEICEQEGHVPVYPLGYTPISSGNQISPSGKTVNGYCDRCHIYLERGLNEEEKELMRSFNEMIHTAFTI